MILNPNNLVFLERFDTDLANWTTVTTGGAVSIVTKDNNKKLYLNDSSTGALVSATRAFTAPSTTYLIEADMIKINTADIVEMDLLDSSNNVLVSVIHNASNQAEFDTNNDTASTASWTYNNYKQIILKIDPVNLMAYCWISEDDDTYGSIQAVGSGKAYTGAVAKIRFTTTSGITTAAYIDEVKVYTPWQFHIGDSIADGKPAWSTHPDYSGRTGASNDQTSPATYQLAIKFGNCWVANRGFGGSDTGDVDTYIQEAVINQGATRVYIGIGHNDIMRGDSLATMQSNMTSILSKLTSAGITGRNVTLGGVFPSSYLNTTDERTQKTDWNTWLEGVATSNGYNYVDLNTVMKSSSDANVLNSAYNSGDGCHPNKAGYGAIANAIYSMIWTGNMWATGLFQADILHSQNGILYPQGYYVVPPPRYGFINFQNPGVF